MKISGQIELDNCSIKPGVIIWNTPANLGTFDTHGDSQGATVHVVLSASGPTHNVTFAVHSGTIPTGLTLNSNGTINGKTLHSGSFTVRATSGSITGDRTFTLTIIDTAGGDLGN